MSRQFAIFRAAFLLGLRGFGGPAAHLRLFSEKLVKNKKWVSEAEFEGLVSLAALLPGPTSSQVGLALGLEQGGILGAAAIFWFIGECHGRCNFHKERAESF